MRAERWWQETSVIADLVEQPTAYEFIQATRLLRHAPEQAKQADWKKGFQFQTSLNLNFPAAEIETLAVEDDQIQLTNLMVGLTGIQGPYRIPIPSASARVHVSSVKKPCSSSVCLITN